MTDSIYLVLCETGEGPDRVEREVIAFDTEKAAHEFAAVGNDYLKERNAHYEQNKHKRTPWGPYEHIEVTPPEWDPKLFVDYSGAMYVVCVPIPFVRTPVGKQGPMGPIDPLGEEWA